MTSALQRGLEELRYAAFQTREDITKQVYLFKAELVLRSTVAEAVKAERERCAMICHDLYCSGKGNTGNEGFDAGWGTACEEAERLIREGEKS